MTFFEHLGEFFGILLIAFCVWFGGKALYRTITDLPPICASIGGGCQ